MKYNTIASSNTQNQTYQNNTPEISPAAENISPNPIIENKTGTPNSENIPSSTNKPSIPVKAEKQGESTENKEKKTVAVTTAEKPTKVETKNVTKVEIKTTTEEKIIPIGNVTTTIKKDVSGEQEDTTNDLMVNDQSEMQTSPTIPIITEEQIIQSDTQPTPNVIEEKAETTTAFTLESLTKGLSMNKLKDGLTYQTVFNKINKIENEKVRTTIENYLLNGQIKEAQEYIGMKEGSAYTDNVANGILDRNTLNRLTNRMVGLSRNELLKETNIPQDVKDAYTNFTIGIFDNLGETYTIVSKTNSYAYLFKGDHTLMSVHKVILGKDKGDQPNRAYEGVDWTTPGGMYYAYAKKDPDKQYAGPGDYIVLYPMEGQYINKYTPGYGSYTLGIHTRYLAEPQRKTVLETNETNTRWSHGCINTLENKGAGAIYDNLVINTETGSKVYVTKEP